MDIKDAFQFWAEWYSQNAEAWEARFAPRRQSIYRELIRRARIGEGSRVLDIGTGTGGAALEALPIAGPAGFVIGIDNAEGMLHIARRKAQAHANIEFRVMDMSALQFPPESFDHVVSSFAIYGAFPPGVGIQEAHHVLRPGGTVTFSMFGKGVGKADLVPNVFGAIFEKYRTGQPSALLQTARQAAQLTYLGFLRYGPLAEPADVSAVLGYMRSLSFSHLEASVIHHRIAFASVEEFVEDRVAVFSPLEYAEMTPEGKRGLMDKCRAALGALLTDEGPVLEVEVVFFHGVK